VAPLILQQGDFLAGEASAGRDLSSRARAVMSFILWAFTNVSAA